MVRCQELCAAKTSVLASEATPQMAIFHRLAAWRFWPIGTLRLVANRTVCFLNAPATRRKIAHVQPKTMILNTP